MKHRWFLLLGLGISFGLQTVKAGSFANPKKRIAVLNFDIARANATPWWTHLGSDMPDAIEAALKSSGKCTVLERGIDTSAGAALVLTGTVQEFADAHQDVDAGSKVPMAAMAGKAGIEQETARCVLDLHVLDPISGHVISSERAVGEASAHHPTEEKDPLSSVTFGTARFYQTLIGKATQQAIHHTVDWLESNLAAAPWHGSVVKAEDGMVFVDTGIEDGRSVGEEFDVVRPGEPLMDPNTGAALGSEITPVGRIRLTAILGPRLARAIALDQAAPQAGDVIQ